MKFSKKNFTALLKISKLKLVKFRVFSLLVFIFTSLLYSEEPRATVLNKIIADTILITLPADNAIFPQNQNLLFVDERGLSPRLLCVHETKKFMLPVDLYIVLNSPLENHLKRYATRLGINEKGTLIVKKLDIWYDTGPFISKRYVLNAYTILKDTSGKTISNWTWEITAKPEKNKARVYSKLTDLFLQNQMQAIKDKNYNGVIYPYLYKRNLTLWVEYILFPMGYAVILHIMLYYSEGHKKNFVRASKLIYYRKAENFESIAINGMNQRWYHRLNEKFLLTLSTNVNIGINSINSDRVKRTKYYNILLFNALVGASIEFNRYHQGGIIAGMEMFLQVNFLPTLADDLEPGAGIHIGYIIP